MRDPTGKCKIGDHFRNRYFKLFIFSLCACRHLHSYLTVKHRYVCVICCRSHLSDLSTLIKINALIPFSQLECITCCMESYFFLCLFYIYLFFSPHSGVSQDLSWFLPSNRHVAPLAVRDMMYYFHRAVVATWRHRKSSIQRETNSRQLNKVKQTCFTGDSDIPKSRYFFIAWITLYSCHFFASWYLAYKNSIYSSKSVCGYNTWWI